MSYAKRQSERKQPMGKPSSGTRAGKWGRRQSPSGGACFSDTAGLASTLDRVVEAGAAIICARTSDGGAIALTLLEEGVSEKRYCASQAELDEAIAELAAMYPSQAEGGMPAPTN